MKTIRLPLVVTGALLLALTAGPAAQTARPPARPDALPPVEAPAVREPLRQDEVERTQPVEPEVERRFRFNRPILRIALDYTLAAGDVVRDIRTIFGDVTVEGRVERDVVVILGTAHLAGTGRVDGSLVVVGGSATIDSGAVVDRDLVVIGGTVTAPSGFSPNGEHVVIGSPWFGETLREIVPWVTRGLLWGRLIVPDLEWIWAVVGILFLVYFAVNAVLDRPVAGCADVIVERPLSTFFGGLLVLLLAIPALAIIAASVIGIAIIPFVICALVVAAVVGKVGVLRALGRGVLRPELPEGRLAAFGAFAIGFAFLTLAYMVPVLGFVTWAITSVLGLGSASITFRSVLRRERPAAVAPPAPVGPGSVAFDVPLAGEGGSAADATHAAAVPAAGEPAPGIAEPRVATPFVPVEPGPPPPSAFTDGLAQYPRATFLDRVAAFALDCVLVAIASGILDLSRHDGAFLFLLLAYHIAFWAWRGTTLGGIICNLKVVRTHGAELRPADALVRGLSSVFSIAALGIGCLWMLQDPERQMWHDKIAGTLVVKVPRHLVMP